MLPLALKRWGHQDIQQELEPVAAYELNFTPEISSLAQQAHTAYLDMTTKVDNLLKTNRKYRSDLDGF